MLSVFTIDNTFIISIVSPGLGIWEQLGPGWFRVKVLAVCHIVSHLGLHESASRTTHSHSSWREACSSTYGLHNALLHVEVLKYLYSVPVGSARESDQRETGKNPWWFLGPNREVTLHHVCNILLVKPKSCVFSVRLGMGGLRQGPEYQKKGITVGTIMGLVTRVYL